MNKTEALIKAKSLFGKTAFVEDRRKFRLVPENPMSQMCIVGFTTIVAGMAFRHVRGFGKNWEAAFEKAES